MDTGRLWGMEDFLQGLRCLNCCCLDSQWKPVQLLLYQFSRHPQLSVVKQRFALSELHLLWILAQLSRISF